MEITRCRSCRRSQSQHNNNSHNHQPIYNIRISSTTTLGIIVGILLLGFFIPNSVSFRIISPPNLLFRKKEKSIYKNDLNHRYYNHMYNRNSNLMDGRHDKFSPLFGTYSFSNNNNNNNNNNKKKGGGRESSSSSSKGQQQNSSSMTSTAASANEQLIGVTSVIPIQKDLVNIEMIIPGDVTMQSYNIACTNLSQNMHFPGFPRGADLPHNLVELIHGKASIQLQAVINIISNHITSYAEPALRYYHYNPVLENLPRVTLSYETIASTLYKPGEPLIFTIECDVIPEPEPEPEPEPIIMIEEEVVEITRINEQTRPVEEILVESDPATWNRELIESMEAEYADLIPADKDYRLRIGDACEVQMVGYRLNPDGSLGMPLPSMTKGKNVLGDRVTVLLKGGKYMPGLVEGLIGMKMGEKITLFVTFPNTEESGPLAGMEISYDVEVMQSLQRNGSKPSVFY